MADLEKRLFACELRAEGEQDAPVIVGHGAVFNKRSENLGGFREIILPGVFDEVLQDDVRALLNHDPNFILGRTASGTLRLSVDDTGLRYEVDAPNTQTIRDLVLAPLQRGDISQSSFAFRVARDGDQWEEDDEGVIIRTIHKVQRLYDVSPVTYAAYPDATAAQRSLQAFLDAGTEQRKRILNQKGARERFLELINA